MVKKITYKLVSVAFALLFFVISTGFNVYIHWCACENTVKTSLVASPGCCGNQIFSRCENHNNTNETSIEGDCGCKSETLTVKLVDLGIDQVFTTIQLKYFAVVLQILHNDHQLVYNPDHYIQSNLYNPDKPPPVKPHGKLIVVINHQFKNPDIIS